MKNLRPLLFSAILGTVCIASLSATADDKKLKAYTLDKCIVSDEKLGEMGKPFSFTYEGREIKLCCKNCKKDFDKEPAKFVKKIETAETAETAEADKAKK